DRRDPPDRSGGRAHAESGLHDADRGRTAAGRRRRRGAASGRDPRGKLPSCRTDQVSAIEQYLGLTARQAIDRVLARARAYVEHETPSGASEAIAALGAVIAAHLEACGAVVRVIDAPGAGVNLHARMGDGDDAPVLVLAHMDTVHPFGTLAARPIRIEDGRACGPGSDAMKTGLALAVEALAWLHERGRRPRRPVELLITCDEEVGSHASRAAIEEGAGRAAAVLVPEPCLPDGGVKTFRKGVATYVLEAA